VPGQPVFFASKGKNTSKLLEGKVAVITGVG